MVKKNSHKISKDIKIKNIFRPAYDTLFFLAKLPQPQHLLFLPYYANFRRILYNLMPIIIHPAQLNNFAKISMNQIDSKIKHGAQSKQTYH